MKEETVTEQERSPKKGGGFLPALCNVLGTLILLSVILTVVPVTVPRFLGYEIYNVVSGSMEPEIPVGSAVYVKPVEPSEVAEGDVIAFEGYGSVVTHRVVKNRQVEGEFVTKGDANEAEDVEPVPYGQLIGRVERHFPVLGDLMTLYTSDMGKIYALLFAACGAMLTLLGSRIRANRLDDEEEDGDD